ncbi:hypothetical protein LguiB_014251 [Lonicera macranthoides]
MADQKQDIKKKGNYEQWTEEESKLLLEIMVNAAARGWRDNPRNFWRFPCKEQPKKKINRTDYEGSFSSSKNTPQGGVIEKLDKISTSFEGIYNLLEKREKERQYTIWDAIKEIPNLEEDTRFKAVELLDTKGKKDVFLKMSPEKRSSWIFHKIGQL